tara:strand:+ start:834 stop:1118 length:285 start_codon:yes stop_codon:yes gene_type:complete
VAESLACASLVEVESRTAQLRELVAVIALGWVVASPRVDLGDDYGLLVTKREFIDSMPAHAKEFFRELDDQLGPNQFIDAWKNPQGLGRERKNY